MAFNKTDNKDVLKDVLFSVGFIVYLLLVLFILPKLFLLAGGGIENQENLTKYMFYSAPAGIMAIFLILLKWIRGYTKLPYIDSILHDPENSLFSNIPVVKTILEKPALLIIFSLIFFSGLVYIERTTQTAFLPKASLPPIEQQVTETADIGLHIYPASPAETIELGLVITLILILLNYIRYKYKFDDFSYWGMKLVVVPLIGAILWMVYHLARYGSSDLALTSVFAFGFISSLLITLTNSLIPALVLHDLNNFYVRLFELTSSDIVLTGIIISEVVLIITGIGLLVRYLSRSDG